MALLLKACAGKGFTARRDTAMIRLWCEAGSPRVSEMVGITLDALDMRHELVPFMARVTKSAQFPSARKLGRRSIVTYA